MQLTDIPPVEHLTGRGDTVDDAERIRSLATMARALGRSARLDAMIEIAAEEALVALGAASLSVSRLEAGTGTVRTVINVGELGPDEVRLPQDEVYPLQEYALLARAVQELLPWATHVADPDADPPEVALLHRLGKGAGVGAPVIVDGSLWGELYATRQVGRPGFDSSDTAYAEALAAILAGAISRAQREATLEQLAFRDALTGLANRRALDRASERALEGAGPVSALMIDVNGLKKVNDGFGHDEGDRVLQAVAAMLNRHLGGLHGSLIARVGGDEFAALVPGHPARRVLDAATQLCTRATSLPHGAGLACGVASTEGSSTPESVSELYRAADAALYRAKQSAGSAVRFAGGP